MSDEFKPVSDDQDASRPENPETDFVQGIPQEGQDQAESFDLSRYQVPAQEPVQVVVEVPAQTAKPAPSFWWNLRQLIWEDRIVISKRIRDLERAIEDSPNAASNYVLRGELYMRIGEYELAQADFERGLALAEAEYETSRWGIVAQALQDRALNGLQKAERKVRRRSAT